MYDLVRVEVVHAAGDLLGPVDEERGGKLLVVTEDLVQLTVRAVLHDDTVTRRLCAHTPRVRGGVRLGDMLAEKVDHNQH